MPPDLSRPWFHLPFNESRTFVLNHYSASKASVKGSNQVFKVTAQPWGESCRIWSIGAYQVSAYTSNSGLFPRVWAVTFKILFLRRRRLTGYPGIRRIPWRQPGSKDGSFDRERCYKGSNNVWRIYGTESNRVLNHKRQSYGLPGGARRYAVSIGNLGNKMERQEFRLSALPTWLHNRIIIAGIEGRPKVKRMKGGGWSVNEVEYKSEWSRSL